MEEKANTDKKLNEKEQLRKKEDAPFMQVDKRSDPISNFISNFKRQFKNPKSLDLGKLFRRGRAEPQKPTAESGNIIGATKTVMRSDYQNTKDSQTVQLNTKPPLKKDESIKMEQTRPKSKKPKLGL